MLLTKARNNSLATLTSGLHHERVEKAGAGPQAQVANDHCRIRPVAIEREGKVPPWLSAAPSVLDHVEPGRRRRQPGDALHPDHPAAPVAAEPA